MRLEIKMPYKKVDQFALKKFFQTTKIFSKQFPERSINSIYFDNISLRIARDNINGFSKRCKLILIYYENDKALCNIEIKKKINKFGFKSVINTHKSLKEINLNKIFSIKSDWKLDLLKEDFAMRYILEDYLRPQIKINYLRNYYISGNVRLTHDENIFYQSYDNYHDKTKKIISDEMNVLELKFNVENQSEAGRILNSIPVKPKRFSKYLRGLSLFNSSIYF